jgi:hypothetical protein
MHPSRRLVTRAAASFVVTSIVALGCGDPEIVFQQGGGGSGSAPTQGGSAGSPFTASAGGMGGETCVAQEGVATTIRRPVDVIFVIDNSGSMTDEIKEVEEEITRNFASIIEAANPPVDYHIIMLSQAGAWQDRYICVPQPLGGLADANQDGHCDDPHQRPGNTSRFSHFSRYISSFNSWCRVMYDFTHPDDYVFFPTGYQSILRPEAFKVFIEISDDRVSDHAEFSFCTSPLYADQNTPEGGTMAAAKFDADLLAMSPLQFGTAQKRNYVWHSIVAIRPYDQADLTKAWPPDQDITMDLCTPGAQSAGPGHQALSKLTGGLRYPTCGLDYTPIFQTVAGGIIEEAAIPCSYAFPTPPQGETINPAQIQVKYLPGSGPETLYFQVEDESECAPDRFWVDEMSKQVHLCPEVCATVAADRQGQVKILFGCDPIPPE